MRFLAGKRLAEKLPPKPRTSKKIRQNSGEENVFKKTHTKDKSKNPTKVRQIKVAKNSDDIFNNRAVYEDIDRIKQLLK